MKTTVTQDGVTPSNLTVAKIMLRNPKDKSTREVVVQSNGRIYIKDRQIKMIATILKTKRATERGFTLVEMMVAIAVFSLVMVVAMGALMNVIDANHKAQAIKTAINNINFALESISKDMRVGTDYACGIDAEPSGDCISDGGNIIKYKSIKAVLSDGSRGYVYYKFNNSGSVGTIQQCIETPTDTCNYTGPFSDITSPEVDITAMKFYVAGMQTPPISPPDKTQPRVVITLSGTAGIKEKIQTTFDLQTSVSARARINE